MQLDSRDGVFGRHYAIQLPGKHDIHTVVGRRKAGGKETDVFIDFQPQFRQQPAQGKKVAGANAGNADGFAFELLDRSDRWPRNQDVFRRTDGRNGNNGSSSGGAVMVTALAATAI